MEPAKPPPPPPNREMQLSDSAVLEEMKKVNGRYEDRLKAASRRLFLRANHLPEKRYQSQLETDSGWQKTFMRRWGSTPAYLELKGRIRTLTEEGNLKRLERTQAAEQERSLLHEKKEKAKRAQEATTA